MRLGDLDALHDHVMEEMLRNPHCGRIEKIMHRHEHESFLRDIRLAPTIDAVPVVRCKDCKHRGDHEVCPLHDIRLCFDGDGHMDEVEDDKTEDEFFCSYGERKEAGCNV